MRQLGLVLGAAVACAKPVEERRPPPPAEPSSVEAAVPDWARSHWAWVEPRRPTVPECADTWCEGPIDAFVRAKIDPIPDAERPALLRRLHLDLTGLPPTPDDLASAEPLEAIVDTLLSSPAHAEHMATWWLDLVRFADTVGYFGDQQHHVWPYRDWVIAAFASGMPFDAFTRAQLAGDLLPTPDLVASAYNRLLPTSHENGVQENEYLALYAADRVANLSSVWLGSTMDCARCHNHPHDAFTQHDFYSLAAFFADIKESGVWEDSPNESPTTRPPELELPSPLHASRSGMVMVTEATTPRTTRVLPRGAWMDESGPEVRPDVPALFGWLGHEPAARPTRLDLAQWLTAPSHPLTSRVVVNRLWARMFGAGISAQLDDFGVQGDAPDAPKLLDWLAVEFVESGWDLRHVLKLIATSHAYRQASHPRAGFGQQRRWQLDAEVIRDQALAVSGLLVQELGGPSVKPYQPEGVWATLSLPFRTYVAGEGDDLYRRTLYTFWQRQFPHPMLTAFGAPSRLTCTAQRPREHTPGQALALLNDPQFVEAARVFAARALREGGRGDAGRIDWAWQHATARAPTDDERSTLLELLAASRANFAGDPVGAREAVAVGEARAPKRARPPELAAWTMVARAILNAAVTVTRG